MRINAAAQAISKAYDALDAVAQGSRDAELLKTVHQFDAVRQQINDVLAVFDAARDAVQTCLDTLTVSQPAVPITPVAKPTVPVAPRQQPQIQHRDGSYYPAAAGRAVDLLPRRVREAVEAQDGTEAVTRAEGFTPPPGAPRERVGHYWIDLARGWLLHGDRERALTALIKARHTAPQQTRYHPMVHETIRMLARQDKRRSSPVAGFAT